MRPACVLRGIEQLIRQSCGNSGNAAWIGVSSLEPFSGTTIQLRIGGKYELMPNLPASDGIIWPPNGPPDEPALPLVCYVPGQAGKA